MHVVVIVIIIVFIILVYTANFKDAIIAIIVLVTIITGVVMIVVSVVAWQVNFGEVWEFMVIRDFIAIIIIITRQVVFVLEQLFIILLKFLNFQII